MDELQELQLLIKDLRGDQKYKIFSGNEVFCTGTLRQVAQFIADNDLFDISMNEDSEKYLANNWRFANENEILCCLNEAKYLNGFEEFVY
ncbi:hypothetical protein K9M50_00335 [Patescibacteria group bacterium]|nr:hypothetical protein [Patescibacteria group bacterium]